MNKSLFAVYLLISKHRALEASAHAHEPQLMAVAAVGDELVSQGHFGADRIQVGPTLLAGALYSTQTRLLSNCTCLIGAAP